MVPDTGGISEMIMFDVEGRFDDALDVEGTLDC